MRGKIEVPEFMYQAGVTALQQLWLSSPAAWNLSENRATITRTVITAAFEALAENPIVPSDEDCRAYLERPPQVSVSGAYMYTRDVIMEWQRRMFLSREPAVPEAVKALLVTTTDGPVTMNPHTLNEIITAAYRLGLQQPREGE